MEQRTWQFEPQWYEQWERYFEERAVANYELWCTTDSAFAFLAHAVAVEAVAERQDGISEDEFAGVVSELEFALRNAEPATECHP